jgi:alpha,alpha-trehalose phosphorylase
MYVPYDEKLKIIP